MKVFVGMVATATVLVGASAAQAQIMTLPLRVSGVLIDTVSDFGGPYAAMPPVYQAPRYGYGPAVLPPHEIAAILREAGFSPLGMPRQRGLVYTVSAIDTDGEDGRMVIDAHSGRILRFIPAYRMGSRMDEETLSSYGPDRGLPPPPDVRREPHAPSAAPKLASRTPTVPLPKSPPRAVAVPDRPSAATAAKPVAVVPPETAPAQQPAVTEAKAAEPKAPETTGAVPAKPAAAAPVEVKPTDTMPPVQGFE